MADEEIISLALPFTESTCKSCGSEGAIGICSDCGGVRPDNSETDPLLHMRRDALSGMDISVRLLAARLEDTPAGHVPCTGLQYGMVLADSDLLGEVLRVNQLFRQLNGLDLGDSKVVGSTLRRCILQLVEQAEHVVEVRRNLMWFNPPESCGDLREMVDALARGAVGLARTTIAALTAGQGESSRSGGELQSHLDAPVDFDRFSDLLATLQTEPDSLDDRVGLALGIVGVYSDEYGRLDLTRVLAAHAGSAEPLPEVARRATHYLSHAIRDPQALGSEAAVLALPASTLACLDRPLVGHGVAFELSHLLWRAHTTDETGTRALVERTLDDTPRLLASLARADTEQRRIALDTEATAADATADLMGFYATVAESGFRSYSWLALDLELLISGRAVPSHSGMPRLGEISQRLTASSGDLAGLLAQAVNPQLRNAASHEEFVTSADGATLDVRDVTTSADEVERAFEDMVACVAGMDAAIVAWGLESGVLLGASPPGDDSAGADYARRVITRSLLRVSGGELLSVSWGPNVTLVARMQRPLVRAKLIQVLAGISELLPEAEKFEMLDEGGTPIVTALRESFARFREAGPETSSVAALYGIFDAAVSIGEDDDQAAQDAVAVMIRLLALEEIESASQGSQEVTLRILAMRTAAIRTFIGVHSLGSSRLDQKFTALLRRAETAAMAAARGDKGALSRVLKALTPLFEWTTQRNAEFNGLFLPW